MSQHEKAVARLLSCPKDYTYAEAASLLSNLEYEERTKGKTSGSRVRFYRVRDCKAIDLHRPHSPSILKEYSIKDLIAHLKENGDI